MLIDHTQGNTLVAELLILAFLLGCVLFRNPVFESGKVHQSRNDREGGKG